MQNIVTCPENTPNSSFVCQKSALIFVSAGPLIPLIPFLLISIAVGVNSFASGEGVMEVFTPFIGIALLGGMIAYIIGFLPAFIASLIYAKHINNLAPNKKIQFFKKSPKGLIYSLATGALIGLLVGLPLDIFTKSPVFTICCSFSSAICSALTRKFLISYIEGSSGV